MDSTSISLLRRLREPQADTAWHRFVELYAPLIFHWGRQQGLDATDAADLVQEVLAVLVEALPKFEYDRSQRFRGWLRTVTINKVRDFQRRGRLRPAATDPQQLDRTPATDDGDLFEEKEYRGFLVHRALELMRGEFRDETWQACWKQVVDGRKAADVAREMGITLNLAYLCKSRVLGRLREELDGLVD